MRTIHPPQSLKASLIWLAVGTLLFGLYLWAYGVYFGSLSSVFQELLAPPLPFFVFSDEGATLTQTAWFILTWVAGWVGIVTIFRSFSALSRFVPRPFLLLSLLGWAIIQFLPFQLVIERSRLQDDAGLKSALNAYASTLSGLDPTITGGTLPIHKKLVPISTVWSSLGGEANAATQVSLFYQLGFKGNSYLYWSDGSTFCLYAAPSSVLTRPHISTTGSATCPSASSIGLADPSESSFFADPSILTKYTVGVGGSALANGKSPAVKADPTAPYLTQIKVQGAAADANHYRYSFSIKAASENPYYQPRFPIAEIWVRFNSFPDKPTDISAPTGWTTSLDYADPASYGQKSEPLVTGLRFKATEAEHYLKVGDSLDGFAFTYPDPKATYTDSVFPGGPLINNINIWTFSSTGEQSFDATTLTRDGKVGE